MGDGSLRPDFKSAATLQNEPTQNRLLTYSKAELQTTSDSPGVEATEGTETLTDRMYQDPRDQLDLERHQKGGIGSKKRSD
jgi:hypothetical protein